MYSVRILKAAARDLERLDTATARRIVRRIRWLAENLDAIKPKPLTGELIGLYKLRKGNYRVVYEILHDEKVILVHCIGHRREIYRKK